MPPKLPTNPADWSFEDVVAYISYSDPGLSVHADLFREHVSISSLISVRLIKSSQFMY